MTYAICVDNRWVKGLLSEHGRRHRVALRLPRGAAPHRDSDAHAGPPVSAQRTIDASRGRGRRGRGASAASPSPRAGRAAKCRGADRGVAPSPGQGRSSSPAQASSLPGSRSLPDIDLGASTQRAMSDPAQASRLRAMAERDLVAIADETLGQPGRLISQAMAIGTTDDAELVRRVYGEEHAPSSCRRGSGGLLTLSQVGLLASPFRLPPDAPAARQMSGAEFRPRLDIMPAGQRRLWPDLSRRCRAVFVLYGGTGLALRLGHRQSVDFHDFFGK